MTPNDSTAREREAETSRALDLEAFLDASEQAGAAFQRLKAKAVTDEREAVVAWLRKFASNRQRVADRSGEYSLRHAANAIERGDHIQENKG